MNTFLLVYLIGVILAYPLALILIYDEQRKLTVGDLFVALGFAGFSWIGFIMGTIIYCIEHKIFDAVIIKEGRNK